MSERKKVTRARLFTLLWLLIAGLAAVGWGLIREQQAYRLRGFPAGIPAGLPTPVNYAGVKPGLNVYLNQYDEGALEETLAEIAATGMTAVKQPFFYQADFDWEAADRLVTAVAAHDLTLVALLDGDPATNFAPPDIADFARWAGEFGERYQAEIQYYIIWDEPNITSHWGNQPVNPIEYAALLSAAAEAIRAVDNDAVISAAPLAPTIETGPDNLADPLYLQQLYEEGAADAFDIVMAKPYGFDTGPEDREAALTVTNFSRAILLREVMERNGDGHKAVWAGNWGWNTLPPAWQGAPSIWGEQTSAAQAEFTVAGLRRARQEWPWMGLMFLENWEPNASDDDPRWGFSIAGTETAEELAHWLSDQNPAVAWPGYYLASTDDAAQQYTGGWRFSPEFGADVSPHAEDVLTGDRVTFTFWGTDVGLRVRRADFRARFYVTVDGEPANALPQDENGAALVLTAADPAADYLALEPVARNLEPRQHVLEVVAARGWDQWALHGFSVGYQPLLATLNNLSWLLAFTAIAGLALALYSSRQAAWGRWLGGWRRRYQKLDDIWQIGLTWGTAVIVAVAGWLTWAEQMGGIYRRFGDSGQLLLTASAALLFYISPSFILMIAALLVLFILIYFRPAWGLALIAFCFPLYVSPVLKPVFQYRFSPVEVFTFVTFAAFAAGRLSYAIRLKAADGETVPDRFRVHGADVAVALFFLVATVSLFFTERLDVASNEWRLVIVGPVLFYLMVRISRPSAAEMWIILDAFVLGGVLVAIYGLWQYGFDRESLITAEGGLLRIKSFYGSPNNVGLYLGRILPFLAAIALLGSGENGRRRWWYGLALIPTGLTVLLTFSKGALFLGLPAASLYIFWQWQKEKGRRTWPWVLLFGFLGMLGLFGIQQVPALAGRLGLFGETGIFRLNLWQASLNMIGNRPFFGVGLDNFLYEYRGRYILESAWREPNLNHPHNLFLDFATRLGLLGLISGLILLAMLPYALWQSRGRTARVWFPVWVGIGAVLVDMVVHGLVDHSFFLVDLSYAFFLMLATAVWLAQKVGNNAAAHPP